MGGMCGGVWREIMFLSVPVLCECSNLDKTDIKSHVRRLGLIDWCSMGCLLRGGAGAMDKTCNSRSKCRKFDYRPEQSRVHC